MLLRDEILRPQFFARAVAPVASSLRVQVFRERLASRSASALTMMAL